MLKVRPLRLVILLIKYTAPTIVAHTSVRISLANKKNMNSASMVFIGKKVRTRVSTGTDAFPTPLAGVPHAARLRTLGVQLQPNRHNLLLKCTGHIHGPVSLARLAVIAVFCHRCERSKSVQFLHDFLQTFGVVPLSVRLYAAHHLGR